MRIRFGVCTKRQGFVWSLLTCSLIAGFWFPGAASAYSNGWPQTKDQQYCTGYYNSVNTGTGDVDADGIPDGVEYDLARMYQPHYREDDNNIRFGALHSGSVPSFHCGDFTMYFFVKKGSGSSITIQYYALRPRDDGCNGPGWFGHNWDTEWVAIRLTGGSYSSTAGWVPQKMVFHRHGSNYTENWSSVSKINGTHPVVYIQNGKHAPGHTSASVSDVCAGHSSDYRMGGGTSSSSIVPAWFRLVNLGSRAVPFHPWVNYACGGKWGGATSVCDYADYTVP